MERRQIGVVETLQRFPVKSMLGEELSKLDVGTLGVVGDRAWALRDLENQRIATAKKFAALLKFRSDYESEPRAESLAPVRITLPDGRTIHAEDGNASDAISQAAGHRFALEHVPQADGELAGIDPRTVFGDVPFDQVFPGV